MTSFRPNARRALSGLLCVLSMAAWAYAGTAEVRVAGGNDDAEEHLTDFDGAANRMDLGSSDLELGAEGGDGDIQEIGIRFVDLPIAQGTSIDSAFIQFTVDETDDEPTSVRIFGELTNNSAQFGGGAGNITGRSRTTNFVDWNDIPLWNTVGAAGADQRTPDLTPVIQEIFDQPGWASGNALSFIIVPNPGGERTAESWNGDSNNAPQLVFTGAGVPDVVLPPPPPPPPPPTGADGKILGTGTASLLGGDLTDPENDGDPEANVGYNVEFFSTVEEGFGGGEFAFNTFDNILGPSNDKWCCDLPSVSGPEGHFLDVHLLEGPHVLTHFTISSANDVPNRDPLDWKIQGSNDGQEWFDIFERAGETPVWDQRLQVVLFEAGDEYAEPPPYEWFRFNPTRVAGTLFQIGEIEYFGVPGSLEPFVIDGSGETYVQNFDDMGLKRSLPLGWSGEDTDGTSRRADSLGLTDGPLEGAVDSVAGIVNVGGNTVRFSTPADRVGTWQDDLDGNGTFDEDDVTADAATDRALGSSRALPDDVGTLNFEIEIAGSPLRAVVLDWDLEVWGGDPEAAFRGGEGAGFAADLSVGGNSYFSQTVTLTPGDLFDSAFDGAPGAAHDPTLIDGNLHAVRGNTSGIVEISSADGAVGNTVNLTFDANHGGADEGWIAAVDNVQLRALAAGDAQADGDVDPADLIQLLAGAAFGKGNIDATWGQGDFDNDGDFDGFDILQIVQGLAGEFPKNYAHDPNNGVPDVLINPATGNITLDTNGTTIGSIVMDSAAGIFNGPNSPSWDAPGDFAADIDTQISMPISFTNPGYTGVDDLGDGIIGDLPPGFDILGDLTIKYLDPNGDLLDAEAHVVPEPSSIVLATFGVLGMLGYLWRRRRLS